MNSDLDDGLLPSRHRAIVKPNAASLLIEL